VKKSAGAVRTEKKSLMFCEEGSKDGGDSSREEKRIPNERSTFDFGETDACPGVLKDNQ